MDTGFDHEVLAYDCAVGGDIAYVLDQRNQSDGGDGQDRVRLKGGQRQDLGDDVFVHK